MNGCVTIIGGSDSSIAVTLDGNKALSLGNQFRDEIQKAFDDNILDVNTLESDDNDQSDNLLNPRANGQYVLGLVTLGGAYNLKGDYNSVLIGGYNQGLNPGEENLNYLTQAVTLTSSMGSGQNVSILAGNTGGFRYNAGQENGTFIGGSNNNPLFFQGNTINGGNWSINLGDNNSTVHSGSGNNTIYGGAGADTIDLTYGNNTVTSEGGDFIYSDRDDDFGNKITLEGGGSADSHATVKLHKRAYVADEGSYNVITVGGSSTIVGGNNGTYTFDGSKDSSQSLLKGDNNSTILEGGNNSTVNATTDLMVVGGNNNHFNVDKKFSFFNGTGNTEITVNGQAIAFGANGLDYQLDNSGDDSGLFVADAGNETLNASGSSADIQIWGNTVNGGGTNLVAIGGSGDDTLVGGTGNSTFTGGSGDNLFLFMKDTCQDGNTVITDFEKDGTNNKIELLNFGLDKNSLQELLNNSQDGQNGNAVIKLNGHTITFEGVDISKLRADQFELYNNPSK